MDEKIFKRIVFEEIAGVMAALADPTRLELLELISQCERNVETLARITGTKLSTVSHHLHVLKRAKLAEDAKRGRFVFYLATPIAIGLWTMISERTSGELAEIRCAVRELLGSEEEAEGLEYPDLVRRIAAGEIVLLDVRPREEFESGHVSGAVSLPLEELRDKLASLPRDRRILAYCRGRYCVLSHRAVEELAANGFPAARLPVGIAEWKAEGHLLETAS